MLYVQTKHVHYEIYSKFSCIHIKVIYDHQARNESNILILILKTIGRSIAINLTVGCLLEYYHVDIESGKREMIAIQQPIIKGNTYRGMWFYQKTKYSKCSIWFHSVKYAINHVLNDDSLQYIDLGPSQNEQVIDLKSKFGFKDSKQWREICDYSGDCRTLLD